MVLGTCCRVDGSHEPRSACLWPRVVAIRWWPIGLAGQSIVASLGFTPCGPVPHSGYSHVLAQGCLECWSWLDWVARFGLDLVNLQPFRTKSSPRLCSNCVRHPIAAKCPSRTCSRLWVDCYSLNPGGTSWDRCSSHYTRHCITSLRPWWEWSMWYSSSSWQHCHLIWLWPLTLRTGINLCVNTSSWYGWLTCMCRHWKMPPNCISNHAGFGLVYRTHLRHFAP